MNLNILKNIKYKSDQIESKFVECETFIQNMLPKAPPKRSISQVIQSLDNKDLKNIADKILNKLMTLFIERGINL